jgi:cobalt-zinc-cadmium efflux system membrane fusion protein
MMKHLIFPYPWLMCLLLMSACGGKQEAQTQTASEADPETVWLTPGQYKAAGIEEGPVNQQVIPEEVICTGQIDIPPHNRVSISVPIGGYVKDTRLLLGDRVVKGQVLATLTHPDYIQLQEDYLRGRSQLLYLSQELERQQALSRDQAGARKILQETEASYKSQQALVASLEARLQLIGLNLNNIQSGRISSSIAIVSPITGQVSAVNMNLGKFVGPSDVMVEIVSRETLHAELRVFEKDLYKIKPGQQVMIQPNAQPDKIFQARVHLVGGTFGSEDHAVKVHCDIEDSPQELLPGMFVSARILTTPSQHTTLPEEAIVREGDQGFVFTRIPGKDSTLAFKKVALQTGKRYEGQVVVTLPVGLNVPLVRKGAYFLQARLKNGAEEN